MSENGHDEELTVGRLLERAEELLRDYLATSPDKKVRLYAAQALAFLYLALDENERLLKEREQ